MAVKKKIALSEELCTTAHRGIGGMVWIEMGGIGEGRRVVVEDFRQRLAQRKRGAWRFS